MSQPFGAGGYNPQPGGYDGGEKIGMQPMPGQHPGMGYPPPQQGGYAPSGQPGYPPPGQPGYGPPGVQPGYGPPGGQQGGYVPPGHPGYAPPVGQPGYAPLGPYVPPGYNGPPITSQPDGWINAPPGIPNCPPGLEYLTSVDQLLVHQKVELLEAFTGWETNNKFTIKNSLGQKVYWAVEENDCCTRNCCGSSRPFDMKIMDSFKNTVIHLNRPLACSSCFCPCWLQSMEVSSPPGNVIGRIEQNWSILYPNFSLKNASGEEILKIEGPFCTFSMCGDVEFNILTLDGTNVGKISKQWSGLAREMFTDSDHFGISFPLDLDVKMKAVCLGAVFLIDMMFFEKSGNKESDTPGMF